MLVRKRASTPCRRPLESKGISSRPQPGEPRPLWTLWEMDGSQVAHDPCPFPTPAWDAKSMSCEGGGHSPYRSIPEFLATAPIRWRSLRLQARAMPAPKAGSGPGTDGGAGGAFSTICTLSSNKNGGRLPLTTARPKPSNSKFKDELLATNGTLVYVSHGVKPLLGLVHVGVLKSCPPSLTFHC